MRIIAGEKRGAALFAPRGMDTRPTQDKVKESLFSMIQTEVRGASVLDLFGGSGALALEALSRGADSAMIVDDHREAIHCIQRNTEKLGFEARIDIFAGDWQRALQLAQRQERQFDLVFLDPPYRLPVYEKACSALAEGNLLRPEAVVVLEMLISLPATPDERFTLWKERTYGETLVRIYRFQSEAPKEDVEA